MYSYKIGSHDSESWEVPISAVGELEAQERLSVIHFESEILRTRRADGVFLSLTGSRLETQE